MRYDGDHKYHAWIAEDLATFCTLLPLCPETAIGLPVPREPIHLVGNSAHPGAVRVCDGQGHFGANLKNYGRRIAAEYPALNGYIFKSRSPSCGLNGVPVHDLWGAPTGESMGLYARALCQALPDLPVVKESELWEPQQRAAFLKRVHAFRRQP